MFSTRFRIILTSVVNDWLFWNYYKFKSMRSSRIGFIQFKKYWIALFKSIIIHELKEAIIVDRVQTPWYVTILSIQLRYIFKKKFQRLWKKILFPPLFVEKLSGTRKTFIYEKFSLIKTRKNLKLIKCNLQKQSRWIHYLILL